MSPPRFERITIPLVRRIYPRLYLQEEPTWVMDVREVLAANSLKDMLTEEDERWLRAVRSTLHWEMEVREVELDECG